MRVTVLGSGGASGTPGLEWGWGRCDPDNPKNRRTRPSILVENKDTAILVDTSPDLRQQLLGAGVKRLDAVLFTHYHADHIHGIDDLRPINRMMNGSIDGYACAETLEIIQSRFDYVVAPLACKGGHHYKPTLIMKEIQDRDLLDIGAIPVETFEQDHGHCVSMGFRFGPIGYSTDLVELPEHAFDILAGVDTWIVSVLVERPHPTHAHLEKVLGWIERLKPRRAVLTHLSGLFDYETMKAALPNGVEPGYDGMVVEAE